MVDEVFNLFFQLRFLKWYWVTLISNLDNELPEFVQLTFDLEEALCRQSKPEEDERQVPQMHILLHVLKSL